METRWSNCSCYRICRYFYKCNSCKRQYYCCNFRCLRNLVFHNCRQGQDILLFFRTGRHLLLQLAFFWKCFMGKFNSLYVLLLSYAGLWDFFVEQTSKKRNKRNCKKTNEYKRTFAAFYCCNYPVQYCCRRHQIF